MAIFNSYVKLPEGTGKNGAIPIEFAQTNGAAGGAPCNSEVWKTAQMNCLRGLGRGTSPRKRVVKFEHMMGIS